MAEEREAWAKAARERDQPGSAREFELIALLLRFYASTLMMRSTLMWSTKRDQSACALGNGIKHTR
jgi:hypothetical protein